MKIKIDFRRFFRNFHPLLMLPILIISGVFLGVFIGIKHDVEEINKTKEHTDLSKPVNMPEVGDNVALTKIVGVNEDNENHHALYLKIGNKVYIFECGADPGRFCHNQKVGYILAYDYDKNGTINTVWDKDETKRIIKEFDLK